VRRAETRRGAERLCRSYYVVAQAGSIAFRLALDTGSADTFLLSTACASRACAGVPRYPLLYDSPTFGAVNANATAFNVSYADGTRESLPRCGGRGLG
jgi:hypothetical protein